MKKALVIILAAVIGTVAVAGLDMYAGKTFTLLLKSTTVVDATPVTNSAVTGVNVSGLPGIGAVVINCSAGTGVVTVALSACATSNGTYAAVTDAYGATSWAVTNGAAMRTFPLKPGDNSKFMRTTATGIAGTTGSVSVVLITE
jgi:hypothetical protein